MLMRVLKCLRSLSSDAERVRNRQLRLPREPVAQRFSFHEGHREPEPPRALTGIEHGEDVRMLQSRGEPNLALKALGSERAAEIGMQHLERHVATVPQVVREVDGRHPAGAQRAHDVVRALKGELQLFWKLHGTGG